MGFADHELRDAYAYTARAIRREMARNDWLADRERELMRAMASPLTERVLPNWAYSLAKRPVPIANDFAAWLEMQGDRDTALAIFSAIDRRRLIEQYVGARARADLAVEDRARDWLEAA